MEIYTGILKTDIVQLHIHADEDGILQIFSSAAKEPERENDIIREAKKQLFEYFERKRTDFHLPLHLNGTPFQQAVWKVLEMIPYGTVLSYKEVAMRIGKPSACRAVGGAVGRNPMLIVLPCHRVIGTDGSLTGFSAETGIDLKKKLLLFENPNFPISC